MVKEWMDVLIILLLLLICERKELKRSNKLRDAYCYTVVVCRCRFGKFKGTGPLYTHYTTISYLTCLLRQKKIYVYKD